MARKKVYATSVVTDIRNFTGHFEQFQNDESDEFIIFIENYYTVQYEITSIISDNFYVNSTGDGVLTVFLSEKSHLEGYAFLLAVHKSLKSLCKKFTKENGTKMSFGIGADSGLVCDIGKNLPSQLDTFVGSAINRSTRIEANTTLFGDTRAAIGNYLYTKLLEDLYPAAYGIMKDYDKKYDALINKHPDIVLISREMMLYYIFEMILKNISKPLPIYRLSESLAKDSKIFWGVMSKLLSEDKIKKLQEIL